MMNSCDNLDVDYKLSPKVYLSKPNYSCEELNNLDSNEKCGGYGSLQELFSWDKHCKKMRSIAQSEPDVRIQRDEMGSNLGVSLQYFTRYMTYLIYFIVDICMRIYFTN